MLHIVLFVSRIVWLFGLSFGAVVKVDIWQFSLNGVLELLHVLISLQVKS